MAQEWRRLQELYRDMSEEALEAVADQGYELTDVAKQALNAEIARRNLQVVVRLAPKEAEPQLEGDPEFDPAKLDLRPAWTVGNREQAEWVKKTLNDAGIPCYFGPDLAEGVDRVQFSDDVSVEVMVLRPDRNRVPYVLRTFEERFPPESGGEAEPADLAVSCPRCHSTEVVFQGLGSDALIEREDSEDAEESDAKELAEQVAPGTKYN